MAYTYSNSRKGNRPSPSKRFWARRQFLKCNFNQRTSHQEVIRVSKIKFSLTTFSVIIAAIFSVATATSSIVTTSVASADSIGQCNNYPGNYVSTTTKWQNVLGNENVTKQAESQQFAWGGFVSVDVTLSQWIKTRVMTGSVSRPFSGSDFGCKDGEIFSAGARSYATGKAVFYVLPKKYSKPEVRTNRTGKYTKLVLIKVQVIGLQACGNVFEGYAYVKIYVKVPMKKQPVKKPTKKAPPAAGCSNTSSTSTNSGTACQGITSTTTTTVPVTSTCTNTPNSTNPCQNNTTTITTVININANCSEVILSNGTIEYEDANGNVVSICSSTTTTTTTPAPPTPAPTVSISGLTDENQIPAGKNSQCITATVYASAAGATLTIDPGIGKVSSCTSTTGESTFTSSPLNAGNNTVSYVLYAPLDVDAPETMTVNYSAFLGIASAFDSDSFDITDYSAPS